MKTMTKEQIKDALKNCQKWGLSFRSNIGTEQQQYYKVSYCQGHYKVICESQFHIVKKRIHEEKDAIKFFFSEQVVDYEVFPDWIKF